MTSHFGFVAATGAFVAAVAYGIPQLLQVAGVLAWPWDLILIFAPSLALAPLFVLAMVAIHVAAPPETQAWTLGALSLAILYAALVGAVYVIQLGMVIPLGLAGEGERAAPFACCGRHQPLTAVDLLGYTMMSLSTLLAAAAFSGRGLSLAARLAFAANGLLAPFLILQLWFPGLIAIGAFWLLTFPAAMLLAALVFRREGRRAGAAGR